jgi:hypothetical protein
MHQATAVRTSARSELDQPVGSIDDVRLVLDDDDGAPTLGEPVEDRHEAREIGGM